MEKEIDLDNGLRVKINKYNQTASVIKSEQVTGKVFIPRYVEDDGNKYYITSLGEKCFGRANFDLLEFPKDSELELFGENSFFFASFAKLQIPPKLKQISDNCFTSTKNLVDIEVSPKNKFFSYINNNYLVGKSKEGSGVFDVLIYARYDIEEAVIPPQIEIIKGKSFSSHEKLKSIIFPENSKLNCIESGAFSFSSLSKLVLPASINQVKFQAFSSINHLNEIEVSPKNKTFSIVNKTFLVRKSEPTSKVYDILVFCRRDVECVEIPSYIKEIGDHAFGNCKKLVSLKFEKNSTLEKIDVGAFSDNSQLKNIVFPPSVKFIGSGAFAEDHNIESMEFLSDQITFGHTCFCRCKKMSVVSLPNATKIKFTIYSMSCISTDTIFKIRKDAETTGDDLAKIQNQIKYFEEEEKIEKKIKEPAATASKTVRFNKSKEESTSKSQHKETPNIQKYMKRIRFLENRLSRYEEVIPFDPNVIDDQEDDDTDYEALKDEFEEKGKEKSIFIDEEDESHHEIVCQIGEGATSVAYKVKDERNGELMCKKVLKTEEKATTFKDFQNIYKEFEVLQRLSHPSICKSIGMNPQEEVKTDQKSSKEEFAQYDEEEEEIEIKSKKEPSSSKESIKKTTIAIFLKYHPMNLKECLERDILNNTLKAKLVVEIAFGMLHIHDNGMIHRDLKLENVMVNYIFEAQLIDFGLAHVNEMKSTMTSMTKGIGTLAYMSPEMANEEEYDSKTDVYSFGVLLFVLFTRRFPKQTMKEKLTNHQIRFPRPSYSISAFCVDLIKKCMSFEPSKRPTFYEILEEIFDNSFKLAEEIENNLVLRRYRSLNRFRSINQRNKMAAVKAPSQPIRSNNKKTITKPVIKKPI